LADRVKAAFVADILLRQEEFHLLDALAKSRHRLIGRAAEAAEFVR
jgi:hypothetical protein